MIDEVSAGTASHVRSYFPGESRSETGDEFLEYLRARAIQQRAMQAVAPKAEPRLDIMEGMFESIDFKPMAENAFNFTHKSHLSQQIALPSLLSVLKPLLQEVFRRALLDRSVNVTNSTVRLSGATFLANPKANESEIFQKIEAVFRASSYEVFEYGMESEFTKNLESLLLTHGKAAVQAIARIILNGQAEPEVAAEALRWLGTVYHRDTHNLRFRVLAASLRDSSHWVRDGAVLGLDALNDKRAIPYLVVAMGQEPDSMLRQDIKNTVARLKQDAQ